MQTPEERRKIDDQQFHEFGTTRKHWEIARREGRAAGETAARNFTYQCGAQARLWIERYDDRRLSWEAGVSLRFSAGPEATHNDRRFSPVRDWAVVYESILEAPLTITKAATREAADRAARVIDRTSGWWLICNVFGLAYGSREVMRESLYARVAPYLTTTRV